MRYAQILNSKVHWIFEDEMTLEEIGRQKFNLEQIQLIDITNEIDVKEGCEYVEGVFRPIHTDGVAEKSQLEISKTSAIQKFGTEFAKRRDATTWAIQADGSVYGYERKTEDVTNFMAAMKRAELGLDTGFNVYVNNSDNPKQFLPHTAKMFHDVLEQSAQEQISAYLRYEAIKKQIIDECDTIEELNAITW